MRNGIILSHGREVAPGVVRADYLLTQVRSLPRRQLVTPGGFRLDNGGPLAEFEHLV